jgi:uncharacterized membrane protein YgdD (TMEM256/DUF423 family)
MDRVFARLGAILGLIAVGAGAFGAHALRTRISPESLVVFETAARYQMYHALALFAVVWVMTRWPGIMPLVAGWLFLAGTILFSGSLYVLATTGLRWVGVITPVGGVALLAGWLCLALSPRSLPWPT